MTSAQQAPVGVTVARPRDEPIRTEGPSSDPVERARQLERIRDAVLSGRGLESSCSPRDVVSASWERSLQAMVDPDAGRPKHVFDRDEVAELRHHHPLEPVLSVLRRTLLSIADEAVHMMIVTDADGHILWREGCAGVLHDADSVALVEGTRWSEDSVGTNAMGTALADRRAVQIHSAEHLVRLYHPWTCAAAPIHDPDSGDVLGAVDLTGPLRTFHPSTLALVTAAAELAEGRLAAELAARDERLRLRHRVSLDRLGGPGALLAPRGRVVTANPGGWLPTRITLPGDGDRVDLGEHGEGVLEPLGGGSEGWLLRLRAPRTSTPVADRPVANHPEPAARAATTASATAPPDDGPTVSMTLLGAERPGAAIDGRRVRLSLRHAEMLTLLALHPDGMTADRLATAMYGEDGNPVTVRSEVHRLRAALGAPLISTQPYRLRGAADADFLTVRADLRAGRVPAPDLLARGPLLPASEAPGVRGEREQLEAAVRSVVLRRGDADALWALAGTDSGRLDAELADRLHEVLGEDDPRRDELDARPTPV